MKIFLYLIILYPLFELLQKFKKKGVDRFSQFNFRNKIKELRLIANIIKN